MLRESQMPDPNNKRGMATAKEPDGRLRVDSLEPRALAPLDRQDPTSAAPPLQSADPAR